MSNETTPKKPFVQVPSSSPMEPGSNDSSPIKNAVPPTRSLIDRSSNQRNGNGVTKNDSNEYEILSKNRFASPPSNGSENPVASLRQKFVYSQASNPGLRADLPVTGNGSQNGSTANIPSNGITNASLAKRLSDDLSILKKKYPTLKESIMTQTWKRKKGNLRQVIEFLNGLQKTHPQFFQAKPEFAPAPVSTFYKSSASPPAESKRLVSLNDSNGLRTSKLNPLKKKLSIQQKFGIEKSSQQQESEQPQQKRRRLVRGSRNAQPDYKEEDGMGDFINDNDDEALAPEPKKAPSLLEKYKNSSSSAAPPTSAKNQAINLSDEEEDVGQSEDEDDDSDTEMYKHASSSTQNQMAERLLEFLNASQLSDICDIGGCNPEIAEKLIAKRPFASIYQIENDDFVDSSAASEISKKSGRGGRRGNKKLNGLKIVEKASVTLKGYDAVESLVQKCSEYGNIISDEISKWGVSVIGEQGELEMTEIDKDKVDKEVLDDEDDDDEEGEIKSKYRRNTKGTYFTHKPKPLAESLELKPYQQVGINWLNLLYQNNLSCILADEMGLGKTCQVISFFAYLKEIGVNEGPHLVIVPSSTLENWLREFQKFCPSLKVSPYYGTQQERYDLRLDLANTEYDILVTTYNLTTGHKDDMKFLRNQGFNVIVYDEGHMLKNSSSERYAKLMKLKGNFRLLLTGTPLQNNLRELISLLAFILPNLFVEKREDLQVLFNQKLTTSNEKSQKNFNPLLSERAISRAKTMMTPFVLRRKKQQVLKNLPQKHTFIDYCEATPAQGELYKDQIELGRKVRTGTSESTQTSSNIIMKLRKAAIHPLLFRVRYNDTLLKKMATDIMKEPVYHDANKAFIIEDMQVMTDFELNNLCLKFPKTIGKYKLDLSMDVLSSGKFLKLKELLPKFIIQGDRILIFSLFTQVLDILEVLLTELSISFLRLDGQTTVDLRQDIIDQFHNDESIKVFILSTKAGGFGINLACANTVVILDQSFNPHDDRQAEDRAHRVGQTRDVKVIRLVMKNTIEENIYAMAQSKLALDKSVSGEGNKSNEDSDAGQASEEKVSKSLFKELFSK